MIKGDVPLATRVSLYLCNRWCVIVMCISLLSHKRHISDLNLIETRRKADRLIFALHRASSAPRWCGFISFFQIRDDRVGARLWSMSPIWVSYIVDPPGPKICHPWWQRCRRAMGDAEEATSALSEESGYRDPPPAIMPWCHEGWHMELDTATWEPGSPRHCVRRGGKHPALPSRRAARVVPVAHSSGGGGRAWDWWWRARVWVTPCVACCGQHWGRKFSRRLVFGAATPCFLQ
jgi:hypothetical protein